MRYSSPAQKVFEASIASLTDAEVFERMLVTRTELKTSATFRPSDPMLLWQSMALEHEIIERFPEEGLKAFQKWLAVQAERTVQLAAASTPR